MSGIVGSKFNHRGSGLVGSLGTDGQHMLSSGAGKKHVFETVTDATYDDEPIKADLTALAIREATNESSAAFNLPSSFIETFTDDTNLGTQTTVDRTSGYMETAVTAGFALANDSNAVLLIRSDTTNGSTTFTDVSSGGTTHTITAIGNVAHSTTSPKWGKTSIASDGTGDGLSIPFHADFNFGTGAYTIEMWFKSSAQSSDQYLFKHGNTGGTISKYIKFDTSGQLVVFEEVGNTVHYIINSTGTDYIDGAWHHYAQTRASGGSAYSRVYVDGTQLALNDANYNTDLADGVLYLGNSASSASIGSGGAGYLDDIRISDTERYTGSSFTPPTAGTSINATGTLIQAANSVTGSRTSVGGTMLYADEEGTASIGTDLKIYFTANGGTNWTEAASYNAITPVYASGIKQVRLGKTTVTGGTDVRYKAVWANQSDGSKETRLHAIGINY